MEDFREKRLPDHLLSMLRKKGDKKKRITSVSYHLSSDGLPFYSYPCSREAGHPVIFFSVGEKLFLNTQQFNFEYQCRERLDLCACLS